SGALHLRIAAPLLRSIIRSSDRRCKNAVQQNALCTFDALCLMQLDRKSSLDEFLCARLNRADSCNRLP
ncbi:MAG: hypothetical protein WBE48_16090, partial [Xanthobacteraceae bacterium]